MKRYVIWILTVCFSITGLKAQNIEFSASASPDVLNTGEQFRLVYDINQNVSGIEIPEFSDFQLLGGPMTGSSTSIQFINGKTTRSVQFTYTYYLRATKPGSFTIPPAKVKYKGKTIESNPVTIEVVQGGATQQGQVPSGQNGNQHQPANQTTPTSGKDLFVRLHVDKQSAYIGEQIVGWVKIYTKVPISGIEQGYKGPEFTGFYKQQVDIPPLRSLERENVNGEIYYTGTLQKFILYPQKSGEITIEPFDMTVSVQQQVTRRSRSFFDDFFGPEVTNTPTTIRSAPVKIKVKQLPAKPASFSGAVGSFNLRTSIDKDKLKTNEALTYKVTVSGKGNIKLIDVPKIEFPANIEQFDPKTTVNQSNDVSGTKTFEFVLIPRYAGEYKILPFDFTYFSPSEDKYVTLKSDDFTIHVEKGDEDTTAVVVTGVSKEDFKLLGKDILFIKNKPSAFKTQDKMIFGTRIFYSVYLISFVLFILIIILRREAIRRNSNVALVRNRKAAKYAGKRLKKANLYMKQNSHERFYEEVIKAVWGYLGDKLSIPAGELSREKSREELLKHNVDNELIDNLYSLLDQCEFARYAPGAAASGMEAQYRSAVDLLSRLTQKIK